MEDPPFIAMVPSSRPPGQSEDALAGQMLRFVTGWYPKIKTWRDDDQRDFALHAVTGKTVIAQLSTGYGKTALSMVADIAKGGVILFVASTLAIIDNQHSICSAL